MAENTPPSILRDRLRKTKEINDYLEHELTEICEFTMYEKQLLQVEKGCSELEDRNRRLASEIENLSKLVQNRGDVLNGVKNKIEEKKIRFSRLKDDASLLTTASSDSVGLSPSALINEVLSTFESLSKVIGHCNTSDETRLASVLNADKNISGEEVQNEVSKLRQILETSVEEEARRLSDSILIKEKLKSRASLFGSKEIAIQTEPEESAMPNVSISRSVVNLLDISNFDNINDAERKRAENLMLSSNVDELERKLIELNERCEVLSSSNEDLEKLLNYKELEIQKLMERLNTPKSPCANEKSLLDHDLEYKDMTLSCSVLPVIDSYQANMSLINNSCLPTIPEVKESSFEGSFDENNVPNFISVPSNDRGIVGEADSELNLEVSLGQGDRSLLEKYRTELVDLQKCRTLLANELEYCMSELDNRNEQITLLQSALPVGFNLCAGITASSDLFKQCNEEIDSLEILAGDSEGSVNKLNAEVTGRLVNVLNLIQKGFDTLLTVSMYPSTDSPSTESSFANMSSTTFSNVSYYPQQYCSVTFDSSLDTGASDSRTMTPVVDVIKPDNILKDVRNLRNSVELVTSDFSREFFNVISKLDRIESIILSFRTMDPDNPMSPAGSNNPPKSTSIFAYKSVLIEDIKEKACLILDLHKSRSDKQGKDSSQSVSAKSSDESITKTYDQLNRDTCSVISNTDSSTYVSATDGDEANLHFMCRNDSQYNFEGQKSFTSFDATLSTSVSTEDPRRYEHPDGILDHEGCENVSGAETILSAFWKTVNEFDEALKNLGISAPNAIVSGKDILTHENVESYKESVRQLLKFALRESKLVPCGEKDNYDPECTQLLSMDVTSLYEENQRKKTLQTSSLTANINILNVSEEGKENSYCDSDVTLNTAVKNWKKLIHDSNKRIAELVQSKNNVEIKLSEKSADNRNLVEQLNKAQSEIEFYQKSLNEKTKILEYKEVQLDNIKSEICIVQGETTNLKVELNNTKENWNTLATDLIKQYQELSDKINFFQLEIDSLRKDKLELDCQLKTANTTIEELRADLVDKEQLKSSFDITREIAEKEDLEKNIHELTDRLSVANQRVSDLENEISSLNENRREITDQLSTAEKKVSELESEIGSLNDCMIDGGQLRSSLITVEEKLATELKEKEELKTNLHQATGQLSSVQNKVIELEEAVRDKNNLVLKLQTSEIVQNELNSRITYLESSITTLTEQLKETRASWNTLILSSSSEIDKLKTTLKTFEIHLSKELKNKKKLEHTLLDVEQKLSLAPENVSDLERQISDMKENVHVNELAEKLHEKFEDISSQLCTVRESEESISDKNNLIQELQNSKTKENEYRDLNENLEHSITTLTKTLERTRTNWSALIISSHSDIDQLKTTLKAVEVQLSKELVHKMNLEHSILIAHDKIFELENRIASMSEILLDKDELTASLELAKDQLAQKNTEIEELRNNFGNVTGALANTKDKILELEKEIASMNESLLEKDQLKTSLQMVEEKFASELVEKEVLLNKFRETTDQLFAAEKNVEDLKGEVSAVKNQLVDLMTSGQMVEAQLAKELDEKDHLQSCLLNVTDRLAIAENKVVDLEKEIISSNDKSIEKAQLRATLKIAEDKLANDLAEKEDLQNNLTDVRNKLFSAEKKISDLETKINLMNESMLERDQLKALLEIADEKLIIEFAEKEKLQKTLEDITGQLNSTESKIAGLEKDVHEKVNLIQQLQNSKMADQELIFNLQHSVTTITNTLEDTRANWNHLIVSSSAEINLQKSSIKTVKVQLAKEIASKMDLQNCLHDLELKLSIFEKRTEDLEVEVASLNETLLEKVNCIEDLKAREIAQNERISHIVELEKMVNTLTSSLHEADSGWKNSVKSSNEEIAQLKVSLKSMEGQLESEIGEKQKLASYAETVVEELSTAKKEISDLKCELNDAEQELALTRCRLGKLEAGLTEMDEYLVHIKKLESCNNKLTSTLEATRENWINLIKTSTAEINRLTALNASLKYQISSESLNCKKMSLELEGSSTMIVDAEDRIREREVALNGLNVLLHEKDNQISLLNSKYTSLSNNFQTLILNCKENFRQHDQLLNRIELESTTMSLEKENLSNLLEEALRRFDGLNQMLMEKEENFKLALAEQEKLLSDKCCGLESVVSDLRFELVVAQEERNRLILEAKKRVDEIDTSKKRAEVQIRMEIVEREKIAGKLASASLEMENLQRELQMSQNIVRELRNSLMKLKTYEREEASNQKDNFENDCITLHDLGSDLNRLVLDTNERIVKLCIVEQSLSLKLDEEKASNMQLAAELHKAQSTISDLEGEIEKLRASSLNDFNNQHEISNRSENFEVTTFNATVHLEQSVFVSDLNPIMERTMFGDNVDPLSMTMRPELVVTPRKMDSEHDSTDDEFGTPEANRFWVGDVGGTTPLQVRGNDEKTPVNSRSISATSVTKNLACQAAIEEYAELQEKVKNKESELLNLQSKLEEASAQHDQLTQRIASIQTLVDSIMKGFYDCVPENTMEQNIVNVSADIAKLTKAINESCGSTRKCLMDSINMLVREWLPVSSHIKSRIVDANSKMQNIAKDSSALKKEILQLTDQMAVQLVVTSSSISSCIEQNVSSFDLQLAQKMAVIEELKSTNNTLQNTLLTAALEKESLRDELKEEISRNKSLKFRFEEKEKELEIRNNKLREESDTNLFQRNNIESIILELLRQWNGDEEIIAEDVIQELKLIFSECVHAKNILNACTAKTTDFNFKKGIEEIISKNELSESSIAHLKSKLFEVCKNLSTEIKNLRNESKNLFLDFSSFRNEIEGALYKLSYAASNLGEESLENSRIKERNVVLEEKLKECNDRITDYETKINHATSNYSSLESKVKFLEENNSSLSSTNETLVRDVSNSNAKIDELIEKLDEMKSSNGMLSSEISKLQETVIELNEKHRVNELMLLEREKQEPRVADECSICRTKETELENIKQSLFSVVASTKGKPIDLSNSREDVLGKLTHVNGVLSKSNDTLYSVLELLNSQEMTGVIALEHLYRQLKSNDVRDAYLCKQKIAHEISSMDSEMKTEELVQLSLLDLQSKFINVIMKQEQDLIVNVQNNYESELQSKVHQLSQYEEREKRMKETIDELYKEIDNLEEKSKSQNVDDAGNKMGKDLSISHLQNIINQEENKMLTAEIENLNDQVSSLKNDAFLAESKFKGFVSNLEKILLNFLELLNVEENLLSCHEHSIELNLDHLNLPLELMSILREMFSKLTDMRNLCINIKRVENEHEKCSDVALQLEELCKELETKEELFSKLNEDHENLQRQLNDLRRTASKDNEISSALANEKLGLELELLQSKQRIEELNSFLASVSTKSQILNGKVRLVSSHVGSIKNEFRAFQNETVAENKKILNYFHNLTSQLQGLVDEETEKAKAFETEVNILQKQLSALNEENAKLASRARDLETTLSNESVEKQSLNERLKQLEDATARTALHDDKSCPYKEKVQELKKELWINRQKTGEELKNFNVMKKNIEEDLAFKVAIIKKLEERNEDTVAQFNLRIASSTASYNQVSKKLEEAEEKISFLREMNSQDKKRLEKDIDNYTKEISKLQFIKTFVETLGIDCDKLQESLPEIKKKLSEYENMQTALNEMSDKNKELEEECDFMNKQIEFLELRNADMYKECMEVKEKLETLKKDFDRNVELALKSKELQERIESLEVLEAKYIAALDESQMQLNQTLQKLSDQEIKNSQLQNAYNLLESNLESRNQKILHYVSEMKNYESMLTEKTRMNHEVGLALEEERSRYAELSLEKSSVEKHLESLQNELRECHARLKDLGSQLDKAANVEMDLQKVSAERDQLIQSFSDLQSRQTIAQKMIREKENLIQSLRSAQGTLVAEKKENEDILKARERDLIAKIESLNAEASNNAVRIVELESVLKASQSSQEESYKNKISSLEVEVESLKKELSRNTAFMNPKPQHVKVEAASLSNKMDPKTSGEFEHAIHKLEKERTVLKRLCQQRRERMLEMENLLRQHGIHVPTTSSDRSH